MSCFAVTETFGPRHRTWGGIVFSIFFAAGFTVLPGVAYFIRDYQKLQMAIALPSIATIAINW